MTGNFTAAGEMPARFQAALVYRDQAMPDRWLVDAPNTGGGKRGPERAFTGPNACHAALEFAHRTYGSARFFAI